MNKINVPKNLVFKLQKGRYKYICFNQHIKSDFKHNILKMSMDNDIIKDVDMIGEKIEEQINEIKTVFPESLDTYDYSSDHFNTSCLKAKKRFFKIINIIVKNYQYRRQIPSSSCIQGNLHEHAFNTIASIDNNDIVLNNFSIGKQKKLDINSLLYKDSSYSIIHNFLLKNNIPNYVTGTVDFSYTDLNSNKIYPIELKTVFDLSFDSPFFMKKLRIKLDHYVTQLCMYQQMWNTDVIFLLLVCRKTFKFTILPVDARSYFDIIKSKFNKWILEYIKFYI